MMIGRECQNSGHAPSLTEPVVMVTGTEIADRPLRVRSGNSAGAKDLLLFSFIGAYVSLRLYNHIMPASDDQNILLGITGRDIGILH